MRLPRFTFRARLATAYVLLFIALGGVLLVVNYRLLDSQLPQQATTSGSVAVGVGGNAADNGTPGHGATSASASSSASLVDSAIRAYRDDALARLLRISGFSLAIGTLLAALLAWMVAKRALLPLQRMNESARRISEENLDERLPVPGPRDEVRDLSENLNQSLDRLQAAFTHERRLIANASHELGTPIANQRAVLEVALADPDISRDQLLETCTTVLGQTLRSESLLTGMLTLARADQDRPVTVPVPLDRVLRDGVEHLAPNAITITEDLVPTTVLADRFLLERMLANLLTNAVVHNVTGGWVHITLTSDSDSTVLTISNSCAPLAANQLPTLTEPFRRGAGDRVGPRAGAGAGLGLAIADSVARAHQWRLDLSTPQDGQFQAVAVLPSGAGISPRAPHAGEARCGSPA